LAAVTPSGEVKAPFGLEWETGENENCDECCYLNIGGMQLVKLYGGWDFDDPPEKRTDDPETFLRALHAALSDHIRRVDKKSTPALREAWQALTGQRLDGASWGDCEALAEAVGNFLETEAPPALVPAKAGGR
jgi:hypothetical protein